jgi:hypothetical protein
MIKYKNNTVKALENTEIRFTKKAVFSGEGEKEAKKAPTIWKKGAPGGCPTSNFAEVAIYSPQSQKLTVGSTVLIYVSKAIKKTLQPVMRLYLSKCFCSSIFIFLKKRSKGKNIYFIDLNNFEQDFFIFFLKKLADSKKSCTFAPQLGIGLWCNGNTADFGSVIQGSSPCRPTI